MSGHLLFLAVAVGGSLGAQEHVPPVFSADVALVTVDAVVVDRDGQPVAGLTADDFELRDEGEPREILSFEASTFEPSSDSPSPSLERGGVSTNLDLRRVPVLTVLWDTLHLSPLDAEEARTHLRPWLTERLFEGHRTVLASTNGLWHVAIGPRDVDRALGVIEDLHGGRLDAIAPGYISDYESYRIGDEDPVVTDLVLERFVADGLCRATPSMAGAGTPLLGPDLRFSPEDDVRVCLQFIRARAVDIARDARGRILSTFKVLQSLCDVLAVSPGRKTVILISRGFPLGLDTGDQYQAAAEAAQRANAVVEYIDPAGLRLMPSFDPGRAGTPDPQDAPNRHSVFLAERTAPERMAAETGGRVLRTNDMAEGLDRIAREARTHYLLGFAPPLDAEPGRFRSLKVSVRQPHLKVRARRGYAVGSTPSRDPATELRWALNAPFDLPGHALRVAAWVQEPRSPGTSRVTLGVELVPPEPASPGRPPRVDLSVQIQGPKGRWSEERQLTLPKRRTARDGGWWSGRITRPVFDLPPGSYRARVVAWVPGGGGFGAVTHAFRVPEVDAWRMSTPVLWAPGDGVSAGVVPVMTADREFDTGETLHGLFAVFESATPTGGSLGGSWSLRPTDPTVAGRSGPLALQPVLGGPTSCRFALPLQGLSAGDYDLVLRVRDDLAGRELRAVEPLTLTAASTPRIREADAGAAAAAEAPGRPESADKELAGLLDRVGRYVVAYEWRFANIVAEEKYTQRAEAPRQERVDFSRGLDSAPIAATASLHGLRPSQKRVTRADLVFVRLGGDTLWTTFRDVFEVDGKEVRDRDARLERIFVEPNPSRAERVREIMTESAAYNIGAVIRTINVPTFPLVFLHPKNQRRFAFSRGGRRRVAGVEGVEIRFEETARPTFVRGDNSTDLPAEGKFWVDPDPGTILRTEVRFDFDPGTAVVSTEYRPERPMAMWVPSEMEERYDRLEASARYSNFRRFRVEVGEKAQLPEAPGESTDPLPH